MASIIIAEDEAGVREFVARALAMDGHTITAAADGLDALDRLGPARSALMPTHTVLPGLDWIALAPKSCAEWPEMKPLLISGSAAARTRACHLAAPAHSVMPTP